MIKPFVEVFFKWVKEEAVTILQMGKTMEDLKRCINQDKYLRVFINDDEVPIDNSASERAFGKCCIGKNWLFFDLPKEAEAGALVYIISEKAKLNDLKPYKYFEYILTERPMFCGKNGNIEPARLEYLMPWSPGLPGECRKSESQP